MQQCCTGVVDWRICVRQWLQRGCRAGFSRVLRRIAHDPSEPAADRGIARSPFGKQEYWRLERGELCQHATTFGDPLRFRMNPRRLVMHQRQVLFQRTALSHCTRGLRAARGGIRQRREPLPLVLQRGERGVDARGHTDGPHASEDQIHDHVAD